MTTTAVIEEILMLLEEQQKRRGALSPEAFENYLLRIEELTRLPSPQSLGMTPVAAQSDE